MHEDIDLGKYVRVVFTHYRLGLLLFILVALVILGSQLLRPVSYTATTTLFANTPQYQWRFDSRVLPYVQTNKNWQKEFTEVAKDPWLKGVIAETFVDEYGAGMTGTVTVRAGKQTLIHVDATASTPEVAVRLANRWSDIFIDWIDRLYGITLMADPFSAELIDSENTYLAAAEAVREFKARTGIGIASEGQTMLEGYEWLGPMGLELAENSRALAQHKVAVQNLEIVKTRIRDAQNGGASLENLPWELLNVPAISNRGMVSPEDVQALSDDPQRLAALLEVELAAQNSTIQVLEQQIASDQDEITTLSSELDRLVETRIMTKEVYQTIRRKVDEIAVQSKIEGPQLRIMTEASLPVYPKAADWLMVIVLAFVAGAVVSVVGCFAAEFIESRRTANQ